jgi:ComF family protein
MMWRRLLDLLFPKRANCMGCGSATGCREDWICPQCRQELTQSWVGAEMPPRGIDGAAFAYVYHGAAAGIVQRLKYYGVGQLASFMGTDMVRAYRFLEPTGADCVVCVPMHKKRRKRRGYNHAELLARDVAARLELPFIDALERTRDTGQQARLNDWARRQNLKDAFAVKEPVSGQRVILVDDVCTTGTTAVECARALKAGGAKAVFLLCYTRARKEK